MTTVLLNTSGSGTWTVPGGLSSGNTITIEGWGGGGGGGSRSSGSSFGSGGGGGAYTSSTYTLTPNDITSGVPYVVASGAAGGSGGDGASGNASTWSNNNLNLITNSICAGAAVGTLPTNWTLNGTPLGTIVGTGIDSGTGLPYIDVNWNGTTSGTHMDLGFDTFLVSSASTAYCGSCYVALTAGSLTHITSTQIIVDDWTSADVFIAAIQTTTLTPTATLTRYSGTGSTNSSGLRVTIGLQLNWTAGNAINLTLRVAGVQIEAGTTPSAWKSTAGYLSAPGGARSNGASGGAGGVAGIGTGTKNTGGAGAAYNASGAGGGGAAGPDGAGNAGTTAGAGGQGDAAIGGAGGAVSATSPGNAGTASTSGGGGGGALTTVGGSSSVAGAGGAPGGGGGGAVFWNGSSAALGGAGAIGQIRITYSTGVNNLLSLAATSAESIGIAARAAHDFLAGAPSTQTLAIHRLLATSYRASAGSTQSTAMARVLSVIRSFGAASSQSVSYSRTLLLHRSFGATSPQSLAYYRAASYLRSFGATDGESASIVARRVKLQASSASDTQSPSLQKVPSKGLDAVDTQSLGLRRAVGAIRGAASAQSARIVRVIPKTFGAGSGEAASASRTLAHDVTTTATDSQAAGIQRHVGRLIHSVSAQASQLTRSIGRNFVSSLDQSVGLSKKLAQSFLVSSSSSAKMIHLIGWVRSVAQGSVPQIIIANGGVVLSLLQAQVTNVARVRQLVPFIVLSSAVQAVTTWFHTFVPLALRRRVVRLPPPSDISTLPPAGRCVRLPREEDEMLDSQIYQPEPSMFSPFDPTDQDTFTFDWSQRAYPNDVITWASISATPTGLNFIGPTFVDGLLVSITIGPFTPLYLPQTYALRCSVAFASGRIGNYSIAFNVMDL